MRTHDPRALTGLLLLVFLSATAALPASAEQEKKQREVTIYRDHYGVPHIYAPDAYALFYGYGYAVATDRLFQMEMSKRTVLGTAAEVLGKDYLEFDKSVRSNYSRAAIEGQYAALAGADKEIFEGYAAGMNARIDEVTANPGLLPREYTDFGFAPSRWSPVDVIMIFVGTMANRYSDFNTEIDNLALLKYLQGARGTEAGWAMFNQLKWKNDPGAPTTVPPLPSARRPAVPSAPAITPADGNFAIEPARAGRRLFSNCWLVGDKKAAGGGAIFMNGPQFGDFVPGYVFEAGLHGAGFEVVGSAPFAYPFISFGHNKHIAWGSTAGIGDLIDVYEEQLNPADRFEYKFNGRWLKMDKRTDTILVKDEAPVTLDIYRTVHGFVVKFDPANNRAFAKKRSWEGFEVQSLVAGIESTRAENHPQWIRQAAKYAITINWYYADRQGNIAYVHTGRYPLRRAGHDPRLPAPGTGEMEWTGIQPFSQNPQVYDPEQGFLANWNNKPADYWDGPDLWFWNWGAADRVRVIVDLLEAKEKLTPGDIWEMNRKISFSDQNVGYFLPFLEKAVSDTPSSREARAVALLADWDGRRVDDDADGKYDSSAQVIMDKWVELAMKKTFEDDLGTFFPWYAGQGPLGPGEITTGGKILYNGLLGERSGVPNAYDFFNGVPARQIAREALTEALARLEAEYGTADMTRWRAAVKPHVFSTVNFAGIPQTGPSGGLSLPLWMNRGTQNDMIVASPAGISGVNVCPPGQSGFIAPANARDKHYADQLELYRDFESKPMLFELGDVKANAESVIRLKVD